LESGNIRLKHGIEGERLNAKGEMFNLWRMFEVSSFERIQKQFGYFEKNCRLLGNCCEHEVNVCAIES
jgi:hypothetical protein